MVSVNTTAPAAPSAAAAVPPTSKKMRVAGNVLSALPVLLALMGGVLSLTNPAVVAEGIAKSGYPAHLATPITLVEIACAALYLFPRTAVLGAILFTGYLGGATATHVRVGEPFFLPVLVGVLVWGGLWFRDARVRALIPLRNAA